MFKCHVQTPDPQTALKTQASIADVCISTSFLKYMNNNNTATIKNGITTTYLDLTLSIMD